MFDLIQEALQKYDRLFLVTNLSSLGEWERFCVVLKTLKGENIEDKAVFLIEEGVKYPESINLMILSHDDAMELNKLYLTYEFSDRFLVFSNGMQYGTMFHYADTGVMTEEEVVRAIFM